MIQYETKEKGRASGWRRNLIKNLPSVNKLTRVTSRDRHARAHALTERRSRMTFTLKQALLLLPPSDVCSATWFSRATAGTFYFYFKSNFNNILKKASSRAPCHLDLGQLLDKNDTSFSMWGFSLARGVGGRGGVRPNDIAGSDICQASLCLSLLGDITVTG